MSSESRPMFCFLGVLFLFGGSSVELIHSSIKDKFSVLTFVGVCKIFADECMHFAKARVLPLSVKFVCFESKCVQFSIPMLDRMFF